MRSRVGAVRRSSFPISRVARRPDSSRRSDVQADDAGGLGVVLVSGGSSGLGAAVVEAVAQAGGKPVVLDRVEPRRDERGEAADFERVDLVDGRAAELAVARVAEQ